MNKKELICALSTFIIQGCWLRPNGGFQQDCGLLWDLWWQQLLSKDVRVDRSSLVSLLKTLWRRLQNGQIRLSKYNNETNGRRWFLQSIWKTRLAYGTMQRPAMSRQVEYWIFSLSFAKRPVMWGLCWRPKGNKKCICAPSFFRWEVEDWQPCSQSCGGGFRSRVVKCIIDKDGEKVLVRWANICAKFFSSFFLSSIRLVRIRYKIWWKKDSFLLAAKARLLYSLALCETQLQDWWNDCQEHFLMESRRNKNCTTVFWKFALECLISFLTPNTICILRWQEM